MTSSSLDVTSSLRNASGALEFMRLVVKLARQESGADGATFILRDGDFCYYADENAIAPLWKGRRFPMNACVSGWVMKNGVPAAIPDIYLDTRIPWEAYRPTFVKSLLMTPVGQENSVAAIGNYWASERAFTADEVAKIVRFAEQVEDALQDEQRSAEVKNYLARMSAMCGILGDLAHGAFVPMAEEMPALLWLSDSDGKCVYLNKALRDFWGVDVADLPRFSWAMTLVPDDHGAVFSAVSDALTRRVPFTVRGRYKRADGVLRILETRAEPRFAPNGEFLGMIGVNMDITGAGSSDAL